MSLHNYRWIQLSIFGIVDGFKVLQLELLFGRWQHYHHFSIIDMLRISQGRILGQRLSMLPMEDANLLMTEMTRRKSRWGHEDLHINHTWSRLETVATKSSRPWRGNLTRYKLDHEETMVYWSTVMTAKTPCSVQIFTNSWSPGRREITYNRYSRIKVWNDLARNSSKKTQFMLKASQGSNSLSIKRPRNKGNGPRVWQIWWVLD